MCRIYAGQNPQNYVFQTRSVRLVGHSTSIRLEAQFWHVLEQIAAVQNLTMAQFLSQLYTEALEIHGDIANFASLLRCCCLIYLDSSDDKTALQQSQSAQNKLPHSSRASHSLLT